MAETPDKQTSADAEKREANEDIPAVVGPPSATIPQPPPAPPQKHHTTKRHRWISDPAMFWVTLVGVIVVFGYTSVAAWQASLMRSANQDTHIAAVAAHDSAKAALDANKTTRALISAALIIPDEPSSKIKIGLDGTVAIDLYVANLGQSWARDVYISIKVTVQKAQSTLYNHTAYAGGLDVSPQTPWHAVISDFDKFPAAISVVDELSVLVEIALSYSNIFDEMRSQTVNLKAAKGEMNAPCCTMKQLDGFMELQRPFDLGRIPAISNIRPK